VPRVVGIREGILFLAAMFFNVCRVAKASRVHWGLDIDAFMLSN
jgi:hypothetical protein